MNNSIKGAITRTADTGGCTAIPYELYYTYLKVFTEMRSEAIFFGKLITYKDKNFTPE